MRRMWRRGATAHRPVVASGVYRCGDVATVVGGLDGLDGLDGLARVVTGGLVDFERVRADAPEGGTLRGSVVGMTGRWG